MANKSVHGSLVSSQPIILDGGLATSLEDAGHNLSNPLWSASLLLSPALEYSIVESHKAFYAAGADVAITCTYQASLKGLQEHGRLTEAEARNVVQRAVQCARVARDEISASVPEGRRNLLIAGSVGPYGAYLAGGQEYTGEYGEDIGIRELKDFHRGRMQELVRAEVDLFACETIPSFDEAKALLALLEEEFPSSVAWFSFTLRNESQISDGTPLEKVFGLLNHKQVVAIGFNCISPQLIDQALAYVEAFAAKSLIVYPNSGETWNGKTKQWMNGGKEETSLSHWASKWIAHGVKFIGGCCRTSPEDISSIKDIAGLEVIKT